MGFFRFCRLLFPAIQSSLNVANDDVFDYVLVLQPTCEADKYIVWFAYFVKDRRLWQMAEKMNGETEQGVQRTGDHGQSCWWPHNFQKDIRA